jgi:hypothetical protein
VVSRFIVLSVFVLSLAAQESEPLTTNDIAASLEERPFFASKSDSAIEYGTKAATDRVAELGRELAKGTAQLKFDGSSGYLKSILQALRLPVQSQSVVFSRTSVQSEFISLRSPRALYFSDDVVLGFIQDAPFLEFAAQDPLRGTVFYTLDQQETAQPQIRRRDKCLSCHESRNSLDVPGLLARSVGVTSQGDLRPQLANYVSDHRSPFDERWSGWYVTGKADSLHHLGFSVESLNGRIDLDAYPGATSDVAALMVFNHQVHMTNLLTRVGWEARAARGQQVFEALIAKDARELVDYLLFVEEAPIGGKIQSTSGFAEIFAAIGPLDSKGRTLRQLDFNGRLMKYPCSYMIYSAAFDALPGPAKDAIYQRLWSILSGAEKDRKYAKLSPADRTAVIQILRETKKDLPDYFAN